MARIRTIKPEFPQSESIGRLSREARLFFILLWTIADDAGIVRASSRMLASLLYPYDDDAAGLIDPWLAELEAEGCVRRYEANGSHYLDIPNWLKHQKIDHPTPSKLPTFSRNPREDQREFRPGPGKERKGKDQEGKGPGPEGTGTGTFPVALAPSEQRAPLEATRARSANGNSQPPHQDPPPQEVANRGDVDFNRYTVQCTNCGHQAQVRVPPPWTKIVTCSQCEQTNWKLLSTETPQYWQPAGTRP